MLWDYLGSINMPIQPVTQTMTNNLFTNQPISIY